MASEATSSAAALQARQLLLIQHAALLPVRSRRFRWPTASALLAAQDFLTSDLAFRDRAPSAFDRAFLKELIARLEVAVREAQSGGDEEAEVDGDLLETYATLIAGGSSSGGLAAPVVPTCARRTYYYPASASSKHARSHSADDGEDLTQGWESLTLLEEGTTISQGTTGLRTWEASLRLGAHLLANPPPSTARILELGAGAGLLGALCARLIDVSTGGRVTLTDLDGPVLERLHFTLSANELVSDATVASLDWNKPSEEVLREAKADVIVAADVVFDPTLVAPLARTIKAALQAGNSGAKALVASTVRNPDTYAAFLAALETERLAVEELALASPKTEHDLPVFPSAHESDRDGTVKLLSITLR